jgi:hypothetical protein
MSVSLPSPSTVFVPHFLSLLPILPPPHCKQLFWGRLDSQWFALNPGPPSPKSCVTFPVRLNSSPEDDGSGFFRNVGTYVTNSTISHRKAIDLIFTVALWEPQIPNKLTMPT